MGHSHPLSLSFLLSRGWEGRGGAGEDTDVASFSLLGCAGLVSGDSALGQTGLGVAAAVVQLILIVMVGDSPQTEQGQLVVPEPWGR